MTTKKENDIIFIQSTAYDSEIELSKKEAEKHLKAIKSGCKNEGINFNSAAGYEYIKDYFNN